MNLIRRTLLIVVVFLPWTMASYAESPQTSGSVGLSWDRDHRGATLTNGLLEMHITAQGTVSSVRYAGIETALEGKKGNSYFSYNTDSVRFGGIVVDSVIVVRQTDDLVELVYTNRHTHKGWIWQLGYVMQRGVSGYYTYAAVESVAKQSGHYNGQLDEARFVHRLNPKVFNYAWVSDDNQGPQPPTQAFKNTLKQIQDATFLMPDSTIYTKYDYCNYVKDDALHGMMGDGVGVWLITPSYEWINGGVNRQELTVHGDIKSPLILQMFQSWHFGSGPMHFSQGERKFYGPSLVYYNKGTRETMIAAAKQQTAHELKAYPYRWMQHELFPVERGTVKGRIALDPVFGTNRFQVVLAQTDSTWSKQGKGYQFWAETDDKGNFTIEKIRPGDYNLYAYALNGEATGMFQKTGVRVKVGRQDVGTLTWKLQKPGNTLWRIGEADHLSKGFCLSDYRRRYGTFSEVPADLTFTIGKSNEKKDWYYAQTKNGRWDIVFRLTETYSKPLRLTIATAGAAAEARARVFVNGKRIGTVKTTNDSSIYRCAQQSGQPGLFIFDLQPEQLRKGDNKLTLEVFNIKGAAGIMYDIIKLETNN